MLASRLGYQLRRIRITSAAMAASSESVRGPVEQIIESKIHSAFTPVHAEIHNESHMHNVPPNSETHFKVVVISDVFNGKSPLQRHRAVNKLLEAELKGSVHALSIIAKTPKQWESSSVKKVEPSPQCLGGAGK